MKEQRLYKQLFDPFSQRWLHFSATPYHEGAIIIFYDIQNEKESELQIKESKDLLQSVIDSSGNIIYVLQPVRNKKNEVTDFRYVISNELATTYEGSDPVGKLYCERHPGR
jgi:hypothetical protein